MQNLKDLMKVENINQIILGIVLIVYIILNVKTPQTISSMIDTVYGNLFVVVVTMILFSTSNPAIGILAVVAAFLLLKRSSASTGTLAIEKYLPSEKSRSDDFSKLNEIPITLEEQMVYKMAPLVSHPSSYSDTNVKPVLEAPNDASPVNM